MQTFQKNMVAITHAMSKTLMQELGATNCKPVSERTLQFDCKPKADGTNRIKVTITSDGTFQVRGYRLEETDLLYSIPAENLEAALKNIGNTVLPATPTIY
jgi:hypothetical protein